MTDAAELIEAIDRLSPRIPITTDLWSIKEIASYLKYSTGQVRDRVVTMPGFPDPIRIRTGAGRGKPRWKAVEVIQWAERQRS